MDKTTTNIYKRTIATVLLFALVIGFIAPMPVNAETASNGTMTQYRYRDKEYTTSTEDNLDDPWILYDKRTATTHGGWDYVYLSYDEYSSYDADQWNVENASRYCFHSDKSIVYKYQRKPTYSDCPETIYLTEEEALYGDVDYERYYFVCKYWQYKICTNITEYTNYCYYKWSDWSEWSETEVTATENREVETCNTYIISYDATGGTGVPSAQTKFPGVDLPLNSATPTKEGYVFQGWSSTLMGNVEYHAGAVYTQDAPITLYAIWQEEALANPTATQYRYREKEFAYTEETLSDPWIFSHANDTDLHVNYEYTYVLVDDYNESRDYYENKYCIHALLPYYRYLLYKSQKLADIVYVSAYDYSKRNELKDDGYIESGYLYNMGYCTKIIPAGSYHTYYKWGEWSEWSETEVTATSSREVETRHIFTITYDANGGAGEPAPQSKIQNENITISSTIPSRDNYDFVGWSTTPTGTAEYFADDIYRANASITLYAVWIAKPATVIVRNGTDTNGFYSLSQALQNCADGNHVQLMADTEEDITISNNITLDMNGFNIIGNVTVDDGMTVLVKDSQTDDYTIADESGYGRITGTVTGMQAQDGYLMITESDGTSFHRLNLDAAGVTVRPSNAGIYYQNQFGGDEVVKRNIVAYGTALGAGKEPDFRDKTYTRFDDMSTWNVGIDENGNSNNLKNGTILSGIMNTNNAYSINKRNANVQIYSQAYVELTDGTIIKGNCVAFSLKELMEGVENLTGVDERWNSLTQDQQAAILALYTTFQKNMQTWNIPNIIIAAKN